MIQISTKAKIDEIKDLHSLAVSYAEKAIGHAFRIGELLTEIKGTLQHGQWLPWIAENLPFNERQAQKYMQIYSNKGLLNTNSNAYLTIDDACDLVATPRPKKDVIKIEAELLDSEDIPGNPDDVAIGNDQQETDEADGGDGGAVDMQAVRKRFQDLMSDFDRLNKKCRSFSNAIKKKLTREQQLDIVREGKAFARWGNAIYDLDEFNIMNGMREEIQDLDMLLWLSDDEYKARRKQKQEQEKANRKAARCKK